MIISRAKMGLRDILIEVIKHAFDKEEKQKSTDGSGSTQSTIDPTKKEMDRNQRAEKLADELIQADKKKIPLGPILDRHLKK